MLELIKTFFLTTIPRFIFRPAVISILSLICFLSVGIWYYRIVQSNDIQERALNDQTKVQLQEKSDLVDRIEENLKKVEEIAEETDIEVKRLHEQANTLREKLYREESGKKSIEVMAAKHPQMIEKILNSSTKNFLNCLETITKTNEDETIFHSCDVSPAAK